MKKTPRKLVLRGQTLRVLNDSDLLRAVAGLDSIGVPIAADSGAAACPTGHAPAVATATGG
jgi:hypothetical protein